MQCKSTVFCSEYGGLDARCVIRRSYQAPTIIGSVRALDRRQQQLDTSSSASLPPATTPPPQFPHHHVHAARRRPSSPPPPLTRLCLRFSSTCLLILRFSLSFDRRPRDQSALRDSSHSSRNPPNSNNHQNLVARAVLARAPTPHLRPQSIVCTSTCRPNVSRVDIAQHHVPATAYASTPALRRLSCIQHSESSARTTPRERRRGGFR